jgi:hypothetical protein
VRIFGRRRGCFLLEVLVDHTALAVSRVVSTTEDAEDIARAFLVGGSDLLDGYQRILCILMCGGSNSFCAGIVDSWHIVRCPFFVWTVQM